MSRPTKTDINDLAQMGEDLVGEALALAVPETMDELRARLEGRGEAGRDDADDGEPGPVDELAQHRRRKEAERLSVEGMRLSTDDLVAELERWGDRWPWERRGPHPGVQARLSLTKQGMPRPTFANVVKIFRIDPRWGSLRLNMLGQLLELHDKTCDEVVMLGTAAEWLADNYGVHVSANVVERGLATVARGRAYLPHADWLRSLTWDGEERIHRLVPEVLGVRACEQSSLFDRWMRRWMISAVARALDPGCKVDTVLVLAGLQGGKKSGFFQALAGREWFGDSPIPIGSKDGPIQLAATWIYEAAELADLSKKTAGQIKQFLRSANDTYRGLYERGARSWPRHSVMCGTVNEPEFLTDDTGNRSFWVIPIAPTHVIPQETVEAWRTHLWAEAVEAYKAGERWWMKREEDREATGYLRQYLESDPWENLIATWASGRNEFRTDEVLTEAIRLKSYELDRRASVRAGKVLRSLGYTYVTSWCARARTNSRVWRAPAGL